MNTEAGSFYERLKKNLGKDDKTLSTINSAVLKSHVDLNNTGKSEGTI